jgi:hypothetical protein
MGFSVGRFAKIWKFEDKGGKWGVANLSISRREKDTNTYKIEFKDGFVSVVGKAYQVLKDVVIDENHGLTVKILNCDVTNMYTNASGKVSYSPHYTIFDLELPNFEGDDSPEPAKKKKKSEEKVDDFVNIADGIGDEELPFN